MNALTRSYTTYSVAVGIVWALLLLLAPADKRHTILLVFGGFVIGWLSATIARYVYPPPKKYRPDTGTGS